MKALVAFTAALDTVIVRLFAKRGPLVSEKQKIDALRTQADITLKENSRTLELIKQYNLDGLTDQNRRDWLQRNFDFDQKQGKAVNQEADSLAVTLYLNQLQVMEDSTDEKNKLVRLLIPVVFSIRKELELPVDEVEYCRVMEAAASEQLKIFKEYLQEQRAAFVAITTAPPYSILRDYADWDETPFSPILIEQLNILGAMSRWRGCRPPPIGLNLKPPVRVEALAVECLAWISLTFRVQLNC